ncbi:MAG: immunoglobulin-like domain-containing protein [Cellulosilyticaceae bacterium]
MKKSILLGITIVCLSFVMTGCNVEDKLTKLGYKEAVIYEMKDEKYAKDIIENEIDSNLFEQLKKGKYYSGEYLPIYCNLLNRVYLPTESNIMMKGVELIAKDKKVEEFIKQDTKAIKEAINQVLIPSIEIKTTEIDAVKEINQMNWAEYIKATSVFDGDITNKVTVQDGFDGSKLGNTSITISVTDSQGYTNSLTEDILVVDKKEPSLVTGGKITIFEGEEVDIMDGVKAIDNLDGDITNKVKVVAGQLDVKKAGEYDIAYEVSDNNGNVAKTTRRVEVTALHEFGEMKEINKYEVTVNSMKFSRIDSEPQEGYYSYYTADEGETYLICNISLKNLDDIKRTPFDTFGNESSRLSGSVTYDGQYTYSDVAHLLENNWFDTFNSINPLSKQTRNLTFEVPAEVKESNKPIILKLYKYDNEGNCAYFKLR